MTKIEFLEELKLTLEEELPYKEVENNLRFYQEYFNNKNYATSENEIIEQLGNPRLIAKTIIDTYKISQGPMYKRKDDRTQRVNTNENEKQENAHQGNYSFHTNHSMTWYQKLIIVIILIVIVAVVLFIGGILLHLFFTIGIPILLICYIYKMIRGGKGRN